MPTNQLFHSEQAFISKIFKIATRHMLAFTLYDMMQSSHNFEDVKAALNDRTEWSIEMFRSCLTIRPSDGGYFFTLCALSLLVMAESMHIHYGRLSPAGLKECAEEIGYVTFSIHLALLDIGFVVVRIAGLLALSGSPALATSIVLISLSPSIILPLLSYPIKLLGLKNRESGGEVEVESGTVVDRTRS